jgi:hypothetical protein
MIHSNVYGCAKSINRCINLSSLVMTPLHAFWQGSVYTFECVQTRCVQISTQNPRERHYSLGPLYKCYETCLSLNTSFLSCFSFIENMCRMFQIIWTNSTLTTSKNKFGCALILYIPVFSLRGPKDVRSLENHILIISDQILHLYIPFSEMLKQNVKMHENIRILDTCPASDNNSMMTRPPVKVPAKACTPKE